MDRDNNPQNLPPNQPPPPPAGVPPAQLPNQPQQFPGQTPNQFPQTQPAGQQPVPPSYSATPGGGKSKVGLFVALGLGLIALIVIGFFVLYFVLFGGIHKTARAIDMECQTSSLKTNDEAPFTDDELAEVIESPTFLCTWKGDDYGVYSDPADYSRFLELLLGKQFEDPGNNPAIVENAIAICEGDEESLKADFNAGFNLGAPLNLKKAIEVDGFVFTAIDSATTTDDLEDAFKDKDFEVKVLQTDACDSWRGQIES